MLDDAASEQQVRPLLPGSSSCAVLITARGRLAGLAGVSLTEIALTGRLPLAIRIVGAHLAARRRGRHCAGLGCSVCPSSRPGSWRSSST